jgi:hypothetical protein
MKRSARFLLSLLACLCLVIPLPLHAMAGEVTVTPLEGSDYNCFWYYFPGVDVSIPLRLDDELQVLVDNIYQKGLGIGMAEFPDTYFSFFALKSEDLEGLNLKGMDEGGVRSVLNVISSNGASLDYEAVDDLIPGQRALRVIETAEGMYSEHLVALKDGWVLNAMATRPDGGTSLTPEAASTQESMLVNAVAPEGISRHYQSYTLPSSSITLTAPDSMFITLLTESPDFLQLSLCPKRPGSQFSVLQIFAVRDAAFKDNTVLTLSKEKKEKALKTPAPDSAYDADSLSVMKNFSGDTPVLSYTSGESLSHLLALRDGWALYASVFPYAEFIHPGFVDELQQAAMRQLLNGEGTLPDWLPAVPVTWEGDILRFPLTTKVVDIRIPKGYGVDVTEDTANGRSVYLYALDGSDKYFNISSIASPKITAEVTLTQGYTKEELQEICDSAAEGMNSQGLNGISVIAQGPLELPAVYTTTQEQVYEQYYWSMDSQTLSFSFFSKDSIISKKESELLLGLAVAVK